MLHFETYRFEPGQMVTNSAKMRQLAGTVPCVESALASGNQARENIARKQSGYAALCRELTR